MRRARACHFFMAPYHEGKLRLQFSCHAHLSAHFVLRYLFIMVSSAHFGITVYFLFAWAFNIRDRFGSLFFGAKPRISTASFYFGRVGGFLLLFFFWTMVRHAVWQISALGSFGLGYSGRKPLPSPRRTALCMRRHQHPCTLCRIICQCLWRGRMLVQAALVHIDLRPGPVCVWVAFCRPGKGLGFTRRYALLSATTWRPCVELFCYSLFAGSCMTPGSTILAGGTMSGNFFVHDFLF